MRGAFMGSALPDQAEEVEEFGALEIPLSAVADVPAEAFGGVANGAGRRLQADDVLRFGMHQCAHELDGLDGNSEGILRGMAVGGAECAALGRAEGHSAPAEMLAAPNTVVEL